MAVDIRRIKMASATQPVYVKIAAEEYPQAIVGKVWRYTADKAADGSAGVFRTEATEVPLGAPDAVETRLFLVQGVVLSMRDAIPTPYKVVVRVYQGTQELHCEIPEDNGLGHIYDEDVPFMYRFSLEAGDAG